MAHNRRVRTRTEGGGWLELHRVELTRYCYQMLGSAFDAEDAVQETLLRAWRSLDTYEESRGTPRAWLYAIATNVCIDMLRNARRRAVVVDLAPPSTPGAPLGTPLPETAWVQPVPDGRVVPTGSDPADLVVMRETIRLAFVAALQYLPPRQRAVLILRHVLGWTAGEVAELLGTTVAAVNSALQRARSTLEAKRIDPAAPVAPLDDESQGLVARYAAAFERHDVQTLVSLLREDATMSMPPFPWWLQGRTDIARALSASDACRNARTLPTTANGSPAFGQYRRSSQDGYRAFGLVVLEVSEGLVTSTTTYLDGERLFPLFDLPLLLSSSTADPPPDR